MRSYCAGYTGGAVPLPAVWTEESVVIHRKSRWTRTSSLHMGVSGGSLRFRVMAEDRPVDFKGLQGLPPAPPRFNHYNRAVRSRLYERHIALVSSAGFEFGYGASPGVVESISPGEAVLLSTVAAAANDRCDALTIRASWELFDALVVKTSIRSDPGPESWIKDLLPDLHASICSYHDDRALRVASRVMEA
jgi:hypothetical protein